MPEVTAVVSQDWDSHARRGSGPRRRGPVPWKGCRRGQHEPWEAVTECGSPGPPRATELLQTQEGSLMPLHPPDGAVILGLLQAPVTRFPE